MNLQFSRRTKTSRRMTGCGILRSPISKFGMNRGSVGVLFDHSANIPWSRWNWRKSPTYAFLNICFFFCLYNRYAANESRCISFVQYIVCIFTAYMYIYHMLKCLKYIYIYIPYTPKSLQIWQIRHQLLTIFLETSPLNSPRFAWRLC